MLPLLVPDGHSDPPGADLLDQPAELVAGIKPDEVRAAARPLVVRQLSPQPLQGPIRPFHEIGLQLEHLAASVKYLKSHYAEAEIIALWVDETWAVQETS